MAESKQRVAVYTGSFDPITLGHVNVIQRAARLADELIVGIGMNVEKQPWFSLEQRVALVSRSTCDIPNVVVKTFDGLAVNFVRQCDSHVMVRGVRPLTDIAGEFTMMLANRELAADVETVFLMADQRYAHVSSTLIKQIAPFADDEMLARFVPKEIIKEIRTRASR
jgi:pantetheine-phosphate adenylyltransferase